MSITRSTQLLEGLSVSNDAIKTSTDAVKTSVDLAKTAVDAVKTSVDAVKTSTELGIATTPYVYNVTMTNADTEYSQALPAGCKGFSLSVQAGDSTKYFRYAFVTGKVATPTAPYKTYKCDVEAYQENVNLAAQTIYFACNEAAKVMQIEAWV